MRIRVSAIMCSGAACCFDTASNGITVKENEKSCNCCSLMLFFDDLRHKFRTLDCDYQSYGEIKRLIAGSLFDIAGAKTLKSVAFLHWTFLYILKNLSRHFKSNEHKIFFRVTWSEVHTGLIFSYMKKSSSFDIRFCYLETKYNDWRVGWDRP